MRRKHDAEEEWASVPRRDATGRDGTRTGAEKYRALVSRLLSRLVASRRVPLRPVASNSFCPYVPASPRSALCYLDMPFG